MAVAAVQGPVPVGTPPGEATLGLGSFRGTAVALIFSSLADMYYYSMSDWRGKINQELREPSCFSSQINSLHNTSLSGSALSALAINAGNPEHVQRICHGCAWLEWQLVAGVVIFPRDLPSLASSSWDCPATVKFSLSPFKQNKQRH